MQLYNHMTPYTDDAFADGTGDWRRKHLAHTHRNTPQSMLPPCCGMSIDVFVVKYHWLTCRLLSNCCSNFHILEMAFTVAGFVKDPALLSNTKSSFPLGRTTKRNQYLLFPGLHGTRTTSWFIRGPLLFSRSLTVFFCQILSQMPPTPKFQHSDLWKDLLFE